MDVEANAQREEVELDLNLDGWDDLRECIRLVWPRQEHIDIEIRKASPDIKRSNESVMCQW